MNQNLWRNKISRRNFAACPPKNKIYIYIYIYINIYKNKNKIRNTSEVCEKLVNTQMLKYILEKQKGVDVPLALNHSKQNYPLEIIPI